MLQSWLNSAYYHTLGTDTPVFEQFCTKFDDHYTVMKSNCLKDMQKNVLKLKGDSFEELCYLLLRNGAFDNLKLTYLWKFKDIPDNIRTFLGLSNRDMGIDLVGCSATEWFAFQCKYRKKPNKPKRADGSFNKWQVSWTELSTFLALATNNKFTHLIVMTSALGVSWQGHKNPQCTTLARGTFLSISREMWSKICGNIGQKLGDNSTSSSTNTTTTNTTIATNTTNTTTNIQLLTARNTWLNKLTK